MNFQGKTCGICKKKLHSFKDEIASGVYAEAYKCINGHVSYPTRVMKTIEALQKADSQERHLVKVGSSIAAPIPASIVKLLNLKPKEKIYVSAQGNKIVILPGLA